MKKKLRHLILHPLLLLVLISKGQDPYFSQFFMSPMTLNPALTGKNIANYRVTMNRKTQWWGENVQSFTNNSFSVEKNILSDSIIKDQLSLGINFSNDVSAGGLLKSNYIMLSSAYNNALDANGNSLIGIGIAISYANRITDPSKFLFQSQFTSMGFNPNISANDPIITVPSHYLDIHSGVHYSYSGTKTNFHAGFAMFHIGKSQDGVVSNHDQYIVPTRFLIQTGFGININKFSKGRIEALLQSQGNYKTYHLGAIYTVPINIYKTMNLDLGLWVKKHAVVYPYIALGSQSWKLGLSYDFVAGDIQSAYQSMQSLELSFAFGISGKNKNLLKRNTENLLY